MDYSKTDIVSRHFSKKLLGGINEFEVRDFLHVLAEEIRHLEQLVFNQKRRLSEQDEQIRDYRDREHILKKSISSAQEIADKIRKDTETQAELIVNHAHEKADSIIQEARLSLQSVYSDINDLKRLQLQFKTSLKASLESHLEFLQEDTFMRSFPKSKNPNHLESKTSSNELGHTSSEDNTSRRDSKEDIKSSKLNTEELTPTEEESEASMAEAFDPIPEMPNQELDSLKRALQET